MSQSFVNETFHVSSFNSCFILKFSCTKYINRYNENQSKILNLWPMNMFFFILVYFHFYKESNIISSLCQDSGLATEAEQTKATNQMLPVALLGVIVFFFPVVQFLKKAIN